MEPLFLALMKLKSYGAQIDVGWHLAAPGVDLIHDINQDCRPLYPYLYMSYKAMD